MSDPKNGSTVSESFRLPMKMAEKGLSWMDAALTRVQATSDRIAGRDRKSKMKTGAAEAPSTLEASTSEFANRILRLALSGRREPASWWREGIEAAKRSMPREMMNSPRELLMVPFELPLALSTLTVQEGRRALITLDAVRPALWSDTFEFVMEVFSDLPIYFSLRYAEDLERRQQYLRDHPDDARARLDLGRSLMKCGLFQEAIGELEKAAQDSGLRGRALYESLITHYRLGDYAQAMDAGVSCLELESGNERARHWLWLASRMAGGYPDSVQDRFRMKAVAGYCPTTIELEEVAAEIGLDKTSGGRGTAVFDSNGDGTLDVVIAGAHAGCSLFRNNGDGTFTDISIGSGLDKCVYAFSIAVGDFDNNGLPDLFISGLGFFDGQGCLMRNNGDGTFTDVTEEAGLQMWGPAFTSMWVDYDQDGFLDLYVVNNLGGLFDRKTPNRLYHNNGDGTFTEVTKAAGLSTAWQSLGATWGDFFNNGRPDLFVSNMGLSQLFKNNGDGTFTDVSEEAGIDAPAIASACLCCDIDNDGWLDIVQFTYSRPLDAIHTLQTGQGPKGGTPMRVFRNNRDGTFTNIAAELGLDECWGTMSGAAGDVSNNGHLDLLLGNGDPSIDRSEASMLLENDGERFRNVTFAAGMPFTGKGHGANLADLAGDGRLHLIVGAGGLYPGDLLTTTVHRPKCLPGNYLNIRLVGTRSNRDAIGARLMLRAGDRDQHRIVSGGSGFGCLPFEQHFGLGNLEQIDHLAIEWPSGHRQVVEELPVNHTISIVEGESGFNSVY